MRTAVFKSFSIDLEEHWSGGSTISPEDMVMVRVSGDIEIDIHANPDIFDGIGDKLKFGGQDFMVIHCSINYTSEEETYIEIEMTCVMLRRELPLFRTNVSKDTRHNVSINHINKPKSLFPSETELKTESIVYDNAIDSLEV